MSVREIGPPCVGLLFLRTFFFRPFPLFLSFFSSYLFFGGGLFLSLFRCDALFFADRTEEGGAPEVSAVRVAAPLLLPAPAGVVDWDKLNFEVRTWKWVKMAKKLASNAWILQIKRG